MMTPLVVLNTHFYNIKLRSTKLVGKSDAQKQMVEFGFGCKFHDLKYFEVGNYFFILFLEFIICLRSSSQNLGENHQF